MPTVNWIVLASIVGILVLFLLIFVGLRRMRKPDPGAGLDDAAIDRLRGQAIDDPGLLEMWADFFSKQYRGASRLLKGWPMGLLVATGVVLALVEAWMISHGLSSLMGTSIAMFTGAVLVIAFIWLVHQFVVSIETNESLAEQVSWGAFAFVVLCIVSVSFFATQVNNATTDFNAADLRKMERQSVLADIRKIERDIRSKPSTAYYDADMAALEGVKAAAARWGMLKFSDCANDGEGFTRQAQVDICNQWSELRVDVLAAEATRAEIQRLENELLFKEQELRDKPELTGDAAWKAIARVTDGDIPLARAIILGLLSLCIILVTAFVWHKLIKRFMGRHKDTGEVEA